jgi:hypothetical protein
LEKVNASFPSAFLPNATPLQLEVFPQKEGVPIQF